MRAFFVNVRLFILSEVLILGLALVVAVMRSLPGPVFFPIRLFAMLYTDLFRGVPTILVIYLLGFGVPALGIQGVPDSPFLWGVVSLVLVYSAYVAEVYRAGIESVHGSQVAAARSLGLSRGQSMRFVILPQAVRRVIPPLLNDFIGLQKDTVLVSYIGVVEAFRTAGIDSAATFNFTPVRGARRRVPRDHGSDDAVRRRDGRSRPPAAADRGRPVTAEAVRIENLHKRFDELEVLKGIDLSVAEHEVICLIGASGSGKSTMLRCINLLEPIDAGRITVLGQEITAQGVDVNAIRRQIGIVFQSFNLFPHMTVMRNVTIAPVKVLKLSQADAESRAHELLERFGLADKADEYPDRLSGGQQQRVAIVRALAMQPDIMLLDEVTSALDPELVAEVLDVIRELAAGGMTMLIATHEMGFARDIASRVCFLDDGVILEQGPPQQLFNDPKEDRTRRFLQRIVDAGRL